MSVEWIFKKLKFGFELNYCEYWNHFLMHLNVSHHRLNTHLHCNSNWDGDPNEGLICLGFVLGPSHWFTEQLWYSTIFSFSSNLKMQQFMLGRCFLVMSSVFTVSLLRKINVSYIIYFDEVHKTLAFAYVLIFWFIMGVGIVEHSIVSRREALARARQLNLDLVEVNACFQFFSSEFLFFFSFFFCDFGFSLSLLWVLLNMPLVLLISDVRDQLICSLFVLQVSGGANPPVCKIMDFNKEQFLKDAREKERAKSKVCYNEGICKFALVLMLFKKRK